MEVLGVAPGPQVGKAYKFLLDHRMEHGPATQEEAKAILLDWWSKQA